MKKVKLAIIGCGFVSDIHEKVFNELKDTIVLGTTGRSAWFDKNNPARPYTYKEYSNLLKQK